MSKFKNCNTQKIWLFSGVIFLILSLIHFIESKSYLAIFYLLLGIIFFVFSKSQYNNK